MKNRWLLVILAVLLLFPIVSSKILLSEPKQIYNLGDDLFINASLSSSVSKNDFFLAQLVCGTSSLDIYKQAYKLIQNEEKNIFVSVKLDKFLIGDLNGNCQVVANYGGDQKASQKFEISKEIIISLDSGSFSFDPGTSFVVSGKAVKRNGVNLNGFVSVYISGSDISSSGLSTDGKFNISLSLPKNIPSGVYTIKITTYENDSDGQLINEGISSKNIKVNQIVKKVDIALNFLNLSVGDELLYTLLVYDQSEVKVDREGVIVIYSPSNVEYNRKIVSADKPTNLIIDNSYSPGNWNIQAKVEGLSSTKSFYINEFMKASFKVLNGTLIVSNIGNVPYTKNVQVSIGETSEVKEVNISVNGEKKFILYAPDGNYNISIDDGNNSSLGSFFLTGRVIAVSDNELSQYGLDKSIIWGILIFICISIGIYYYRNRPLKNYTAKSPLKVLAPINLTNSHSKNSQSVIENGERKDCAIIFLKAKNFDEIEKSTSNAMDSIRSAVSKAESAGGKPIIERGSWIIVFPSQSNRESLFKIVKVAQKVEELLKEHNRKYSHKIDFGLSMHVGELIIDLASDKFKASSTGNTLLIGRRVAESAKKELLISEKVHSLTLGSVKAEKVSDNGWRIQKLVERANHSQFIEGFKKRQDLSKEELIKNLLKDL